MKVTLEREVKANLEEFVSFLQKRAMTDDHEANRDLIADFIDSFMVVELKRLNNTPETYQEDVEIPDAVLLAPLEEARKGLNEALDKFMGGQGLTAPAVAPAPKAKQAPAVQPAFPSQPSSSSRSGNGHARGKVRDLNDDEKNMVRSFFQSLNGQIDSKACTKFRAANLEEDVTVFQVTGFVTYLHKEIAEGESRVGNMVAYETFLQGHRDMWDKYDSPKYRAMRADRIKARMNAVS